MLKFNKTRGYGFTLIELLAVIVILAIIALIATPIVLNIIEDSKKSAFMQTGNGIVDAAEYYYMKEMSDGAKPTENKVFTFNGTTTGLEGLEFDGEIPKEGTLTVDVNGNIQLEAHNNQYCLTKGYEENEITIKDYDGNCNVSGSASTASICTLVDDADDSGTVTAGDKYQCKVKDNMEEGFENGYYFYVLSHNYDENDNTKIISTNLIMDRNICEDGTVATSNNTCLYAYNIDGDAAGVGPVTAIAKLNAATSSWKDELALNIIYDDEARKFTNFSITGKARMPYKSEVSHYDGTNRYLYDYLKSNDSIQINPISGIYGYWTLSSYAFDSRHAWGVQYNGGVRSGYYVDSGICYGVRPVINLKI